MGSRYESILKMEKAKRKCVHCRHLERHKRKDSIGICYQYNVLVLDSLCGCVRQKGGTIKLLNFQLNNEEKRMLLIISTIKSTRTRNLRFNSPALASLGFADILEELYSIMDACSDVQWFVDQDDDTLLNALDGDDEAEWEFRMAFADLSGKSGQLYDMIQDNIDYQTFDDCIVSLIGNRYQLVGFDMDEEDYFSLTAYEQELAYTEAGKRLMRKTKAEIISTVGQCIGILIAFLDVRQSFDYLKATFDILKDENTSLLQLIKEIDQAYEKAADVGFYSWHDEVKAFDRLLEALPERAWIE